MLQNESSPLHRRRCKTDILLNNLCEVFNSQLVDDKDRPIISPLEYAREYLMKKIMLVKQVIDRSDGPLTPTATRLFKVVKAKASECISNLNGGNFIGLDTWKQVYNHHINPIRGKIMWPKSPIPTISLPQNHHPQVGRLPKNIKKSAGEDIQMGHNKRSCTGPRKDAGNKGSTSNACKKRPRSETTTGTSQAGKKPNNAHVGVQTRSQASNQGKKATVAAKKLMNKGKKTV
ncbi:hypothetical protein Tco_0538066 [Tanacetum coccineum]